MAHSSLHTERLIIIDKDPWAAQGLKELLLSHSNVTILGVVTTFQDGLSIVRRQAPTAVVLGFREVTPNGTAMIRRVRRLARVPVIVLAYENRIDAVGRILQAGAGSYLHKGLEFKELSAYLRESLAGRSVVAVPDPLDWLKRVIGTHDQCNVPGSSS